MWLFPLNITYLPNYETNFKEVTFSDVANATIENTSSFAKKFLETIACNRAFVRCVRNFLMFILLVMMKLINLI